MYTHTDQISLFFDLQEWATDRRTTYEGIKTPGFFLVDARKFLAVHLEYFELKFMQIFLCTDSLELIECKTIATNKNE
jgi:hypothetical protein